MGQGHSAKGLGGGHWGAARGDQGLSSGGARNSVASGQVVCGEACLRFSKETALAVWG